MLIFVKHKRYDEEGNNEVTVFSLDEKIHINNDEWSYGIYKPVDLYSSRINTIFV